MAMAPTTIETRNCENCGAPVTRRRNGFRNKKWVACSKDCWKIVKSRIATLHPMNGMRFGALLITGRSVGGVEYVCDCGKAGKTRHVEALRSGRMRSCGCQKPQNIGKAVVIHGGTSRFDKSLRLTHNTWRSMRIRCYQPSNNRWSRYGGKGIKMCDAWFHSFEAFLEDMGVRPEGHTLDRIDFTGDYSPSNCRWANNIQQQNNRHDNHVVEFGGRQLTIAEWSRERGLNQTTLWTRLTRLKWPIERALNEPIRGHQGTTDRASSTRSV